MQGACVGGGIDIIAACDLRYASAHAWFCVKEIDVGLVADVGTLQRLPRLVGEGLAREMAFTGRRVDGPEAQSMRLVNQCFDSDKALADGVMAMALKLDRVPGVDQGNRSAWKRAAAAYLGTSYAPYINGILYWADNYKKLL